MLSHVTPHCCLTPPGCDAGQQASRRCVTWASATCPWPRTTAASRHGWRRGRQRPAARAAALRKPCCGRRGQVRWRWRWRCARRQRRQHLGLGHMVQSEHRKQLQRWLCSMLLCYRPAERGPANLQACPLGSTAMPRVCASARAAHTLSLTHTHWHAHTQPCVHSLVNLFRELDQQHMGVHLRGCAAFTMTPPGCRPPQRNSPLAKPPASTC